MISFNPPKPQWIEELITIWRPHRQAQSLLGEGYSGSTLSNAVESQTTRGNRGAVNRSPVYQHPQTRAKAKADLG